MATAPASKSRGRVTAWWPTSSHFEELWEWHHTRFHQMNISTGHGPEPAPELPESFLLSDPGQVFEPLKASIFAEGPSENEVTPFNA